MPHFADVFLKAVIFTNLAATAAFFFVLFRSQEIKAFLSIIPLSPPASVDRERYVAQCRKLFYAVSKNERFHYAVAGAAHKMNEIFLGFQLNYS